MILWFVYLELRDFLRLYIIWVERVRQIASRIDGFSRGCLTDWIASYGSILYFVSLNEITFESSPFMLAWLQTWIGVNNIEPLTPEGWFKECRLMKVGNKNYYGIWMPYHSKGHFLWAPASSVADLVFRILG